MTYRTLLGLALAAVPVALAAQAPRAPLPLKHAPRPTSAPISEADLMTRLYIVADDSMMGREAGTEGSVKGTAYIARELQRMGLRPAGDNGTFFQEIPLYRRSLDASSTVSAEGATIAADGWMARDQGAGARAFDGAQAVFGGTWGTPATLITAEEAAGKVVVLQVPTGADGRPSWQVNRGQVVRRFPGAAAIAYASLEHIPANVAGFYRAPGTDMKDDSEAAPAIPAWIYVNAATAEALLGTPLTSAARGQAGKTVRGHVTYREEKIPARNVIAVLPGSDPALRGQYVAIGAHSDHVGVNDHPVDHDSLRAFNRVMRPNGAEDQAGTPTAEQWTRIRAIRDSLRAVNPARADSTYNGADDDGSGTVAVLEIAEALKAGPAPKRSILFVWHTAEELGLLGATHFSEHPTVPRDSIVTQLNIDMIGRGSETDLEGGGPRYLQLIGSKRLSTELGAMVETVNGRQALPFQIDYTYDADGHPANYYCRSDHYAYARFGIPITFFSTGGHQDYHMLTDEPQYIDYAHLARVTKLINDVAVQVANLDHRPVVDRPVPDRNQPCRQ